MGYTALLIFAGLQSIPNTVYEANKMDGASEWTMFWRITVPLLRPILALVLIMTMIGSFQVFDTVSVATQDGPVNTAPPDRCPSSSRRRPGAGASSR